MRPARTALLLLGGLLAHGEVIDVGTFGVAPYVIEQGEKAPTGAIVEFFDREIAPRMGVTFRWPPVVTVPRLLAGLQNGSYRMTPLLTRTPERAQQVLFVNTSHVSFTSTLVLRPAHPLAGRNRLPPSALDGLRIAWVQAGPLPPELERPGIHWDRTSVPNWERANLGKLALGRVDAAYFSNPATPAWHARQQRLDIQMVPLDVPPRPLYAAFAPDTPPSLIARFERAAQQAFANGQFERYLSRWLSAEASPVAADR